MILTVTLNPMLDRTLHLERFPVGQISRSSKVANVAGGKGINVSRQLRLLGEDTLATGFLGGEIGAIVEGLMSKEGVAHDFLHVRDTTRIGFTVLETSTGVQTSILEPGPRVEPEEIERLKRQVAGWIESGRNGARIDWLVCSGTTPCEGMDDLYADLIRVAHRHKVKVVLDTYPTPLALGLREKPFLVKPNVREYEMTFGPHRKDAAMPWSDTESLHALAHLRSFGVQCAVITHGEQEAFVSFGELVWRITPPRVECVNPTGSGDSMIAGLLHGLVRNWDIERTLLFGMAAGAANARTWKVAASTLEEITELVPGVVMERLK
ncbi:MAG: 1-phosphofructokinase family hexose kinase [Armatimonadetes bacterium]|nr:1-phosphofructokinase family hexose kinase [Armatimonadota bacterium]